jgi:oligopeptide transport system ATP-binding protein
LASPLLQVRNLKTEFAAGTPAALTAVNDVSFDVDAGETLAIVGESGSGKSITALSIMRLVPEPPGKITAGEVIFDGVNLLELPEDEMRKVRGNRIAMIFQEPMTSLNPSLTIGLQIAEPINLHKKLPWPQAFDKAKELLDRVRMPDARSRLSTHPHQFSGGMRQRIMIAMALACQPKLIIADEPTTALDVTVQAQILELLKELTRETGAALILITHDLGVVARYADRVCVMYGGKVIETAAARELYEKPLHPYTRGLMASIPRLDEPAGRRLVPIRGQPPNLAQLPSGCSFNPRCGEAVERCRSDVPGLMRASEGHLHACWMAPHGQ